MGRRVSLNNVAGYTSPTSPPPHNKCVYTGLTLSQMPWNKYMVLREIEQFCGWAPSVPYTSDSVAI